MFEQDSENNTILILLADVKPPSTSPYGPSDPDFVGAALRMARYYFDRYPFILDWSDAYGKTALHVAALKGNEELVRVRIITAYLEIPFSDIELTPDAM